MRNLMVILSAFLQMPFFLLNSVNYAVVLRIATGANSFLSAFSEGQRDALAMLFLGFLLRTLGVWLVVNGFAYLAICFSGFLAPQYGDVVDKITSPILYGEIAFALWIAILGARKLGRPSPASI